MTMKILLLAAMVSSHMAHFHGGSETTDPRVYLQERLTHELGASESLSEALSHQFLERMLAEGKVGPEDWSEEHATIYNKEWAQNVTRTTYTSPAIKLATGEAHFTLNPIFKIPMPKGDYVLLNAQWDIVDENGKGVPLTELYNHHWLVGTNSNVDPLAMCEEDLFWGGGAEFRRLDYRNPGGYGIVRIGASGHCGANLHFIRVDGLKTHWDGMNDPKNDTGAAIKNCAECGYAPGRDLGVCDTFFDGTFGCCFTGSRCPVVNPHDRTRKSYFLKGTFDWSRNLTGVKNVRINLLDVGGGPRVQKGQFMFGTEWNVDSYLNNYGANTQCNSTVCNATNSVVIGEQKSLENGWCAGEMIWSYGHMHAGAIETTMFVNGKAYCKSVPQVGTDPHNTPPNEKGFVVDISNCVDKRTMNNSLVLKTGDVLTVTTLYDVDPKSKRNAPFPGGKHGGIMALFFGVMHCDPGTYGEKYVCTQGQCIGVKKHVFWKKTYNDFTSCTSACGSEDPAETYAVAPIADSSSAEPEPKVNSPKIGTVAVEWKDCGNEKSIGKITSLTPSTIHLNGKTSIVGSGSIPKNVTAGNVTLKMASGLLGFTFFDFTSDLCGKKQEYSLYGQMRLTWAGWSCPTEAGNVSAVVELDVGLEIPPLAASTTTTVVASDAAGDMIFCLEVLTKGNVKASVDDLLI